MTVSELVILLSVPPVLVVAALLPTLTVSVKEPVSIVVATETLLISTVSLSAAV